MTQENTNGDTRSAAPSAQDRPQIPQHEVSIADLSKKILATDKQYDLSKILSAYQLAEKAHADQKRSSGEPYIIHPLAVADILLDLGMDTDTICVGLLHDVVEDTNYTLDDIRKKFGQDVAMLVDGVTKLNRIPIFDKEQQQAENVRKILLAMSHDIRVMIIKLADRIHNMRTLKFLPPETCMPRLHTVWESVQLRKNWRTCRSTIWTPMRIQRSNTSWRSRRTNGKSSSTRSRSESASGWKKNTLPRNLLLKAVSRASMAFTKKFMSIIKAWTRFMISMLFV